MSNRVRYVIYGLIAAALVAVQAGRLSARGGGGGPEATPEVAPPAETARPSIGHGPGGVSPAIEVPVSSRMVAGVRSDEPDAGLVARIRNYRNELAASAASRNPFEPIVPREVRIEAAPVEVAPTVRPWRERPSTSVRLSLTGVSRDSREAFAVLNRRVVTIGDTVEGLTVVGIRSDGVELRDPEGIVWVLTFEDVR